MGSIVLLAIAAAAYQSRGPDFESTLDWRAGSARVQGVAKNNTDHGCSHVTIDLKLKDHNDAVIRTESLDLGEIASKSSAAWDKNLTALGVLPSNVPAGTTHIEQSVSCADQH